MAASMRDLPGQALVVDARHAVSDVRDTMCGFEGRPFEAHQLSHAFPAFLT